MTHGQRVVTVQTWSVRQLSLYVTHGQRAVTAQTWSDRLYLSDTGAKGCDLDYESRNPNYSYRILSGDDAQAYQVLVTTGLTV